MPILAREPSCYPAQLLEVSTPNADQRWWVFYTRPRAEKAIARYLRARQVAYFLPLYKRHTRIRGRTLVSWNVLFPNYIFVFGSDSARLATLKTGFVVHEVAVADHNQLHNDLVKIHTVQEAQLPYYPELNLNPGEAVTVTAGPLMGLTGKVISWFSPMRLVIELRLLQRAVCVELEPWMVSHS